MSTLPSGPGVSDAHHVAPAPADAGQPLDGSPKALRRKRRLWDLPTQAHELLLATSFCPEVLRREAACTLGQIHHGVCKLQGSDVDVLYSLVHDLNTRNPMSEALQKRLDERHCLSLSRMRRLREPDAVRAAWAQALAGHEMPGALWALLTHPLGAELEGPALYDARGWVFAHCRRSVALGQAQAASREEERLARQQVEDLRLRLTRQQQQSAAALGQAQAELARLRGEVARLSLPPEAPRPLASIQGRQLPPPHAPHTMDDPPTSVRVTPRAAANPATAEASPAATFESERVAMRPANAVQGRRVLCVGGIQHAVAHYRARIERMGGHFEHHDGGLEDSVQGLDGRLHRAEVVICQAACINHEAYQRIKRHCERTGTPCMYLERPSLSRFARALHEMAAPAANQVPQHAA